MGDTKENYIEYREEELEKLGAFGYDIYVVDKDGNEKFALTTTETNATINVSSYTGDIKFIVKTAWEKDKTTISSGSEYTLSMDTPLSLVTVSLKGNPTINLNLNDTYTDEGVIVLDNFVDVTNGATITKTITNSNNEIVETINTSSVGTYKIKYTIIYNNSTYEEKRTINVIETSENPET